jgi:hypothetical protein
VFSLFRHYDISIARVSSRLGLLKRKAPAIGEFVGFVFWFCTLDRYVGQLARDASTVHVGGIRTFELSDTPF